MPNIRALTGAEEAEAQQLLATGATARSVARKFGVDHKTITKIAHGKRSEASETSIGKARDAFERAQLATFRNLKRRLRNADDRNAPALAKAMNDTIKAIRQHRLLSKAAGTGDEPSERVADMMIAKLQRLAERAPVAPAAVEVVEDERDEAAEG